MGNLRPEHYLWIDPSWLNKPRGKLGNYTVFADCFWLANEAGEIAFYKKSYVNILKAMTVAPQCNPDLRVAERIFPITPGASQIIQIPLSFLHQDDYWGCYLTDKELEDHGAAAT